MASATYNRIVIRHANEQGDVTRIEGLAGEAGIGPGDLLEEVSGTFLRHNTANGPIVPKIIALETQTPDDEDDITIDVDYANGDTVYAAIGKPGDRFNMWLASGQTAVAGDYLVSDGDGALNVEAAIDQTDIIESVIGRAVADSDAALALTRVIVEIT